jgi:hypothetical protein
MKPSLHRLNSFLSFILELPIPKTRLNSIPSSYPGKLASRNSTRLDSTTVLSCSSQLLYEWRFTANQFVLATTPLRLTISNISQLNTCGHSPYVTSSLMRGWVCRLQFTAGPRQPSHSQIRVPRDSQSHVTVSDSRLSKPGDPGPRIYIPQEQGGPVIPPGTGFSFRRLLRLAGLRWRYSIRLRTGCPAPCCRTLLYNHFAPTTQKTQPLLLRRRVY